MVIPFCCKRKDVGERSIIYKDNEKLITFTQTIFADEP